ncbi:MAG: DUF5694 domain-containing protein [Bacteroidota bacterium]
MKLIYCIFCIAVFFNTASSQRRERTQNQVQFRYADDFLADNLSERTKVLILGVWHFDYPNLDAHKVDPAEMVDVIMPERQKEIGEVLDVLKKYHPTKILIEAKNGEKIDSLYQAYLDGNYSLTRSETDQLGFRLALQLQMKKIYSVDAGNYLNDKENNNPDLSRLWSSASAVDSLKDRRWDNSYATWYDYEDKILSHCTIMDKLLYLNDQRNVRRMYGNYLVSGFNTTDNTGPDKLALWWYDRNLRIFNNILNSKPTPADRLLIIFGSGHQPILQHCFEASPQFELVQLSDVVKAAPMNDGMEDQKK